MRTGRPGSSTLPCGDVTLTRSPRSRPSLLAVSVGTSIHASHATWVIGSGDSCSHALSAPRPSNSRPDGYTISVCDPSPASLSVALGSARRLPSATRCREPATPRATTPPRWSASSQNCGNGLTGSRTSRRAPATPHSGSAWKLAHGSGPLPSSASSAWRPTESRMSPVAWRRRACRRSAPGPSSAASARSRRSGPRSRPRTRAGEAWAGSDERGPSSRSPGSPPPPPSEPWRGPRRNRTWAACCRPGSRRRGRARRSRPCPSPRSASPSPRTGSPGPSADSLPKMTRLPTAPTAALSRFTATSVSVALDPVAASPPPMARPPFDVGKVVGDPLHDLDGNIGALRGRGHVHVLRRPL